MTNEMSQTLVVVNGETLTLAELQKRAFEAARTNPTDTYFDFTPKTRKQLMREFAESI